MNQTTIDGVPALIIERWQGAHGCPSLFRWRSLAQLCSSAWMSALLNGSTPGQASNLRMLADIAYQHQLDTQNTQHFIDRRAADLEAA